MSDDESQESLAGPMGEVAFQAKELDGEASMNDASALTMFTGNLNLQFSSGSFSEFHFSRRASDLSGEAQNQKLKPAEFFQSKMKSEREFPVSRLQFSSLGLVGRDEEMALLRARLKRVAPQEKDQKGSRELVLISGDSGTGKSVLAASLEKPIKRLGGLYVKGKFDLYLRDEPYVGIAAACREICGIILLLRDDESFNKIRDELVEKLGSDNLCLLINIIPELSEIVGDDVITNGMKEYQSGEETKARFNYAFRIFIRVVASNFAPLVILLDDIQWSDAATLDLIQVLIADRDNPSLMVIGVYRSNEVDETHPLTSRIQELKRMAGQDDFNITEIAIGDLNLSQINEVIMRLLSVDEPSKTIGLVDICNKRTNGNAFSLVVFLEMLQAEGLLQFNLGKFKWEWDDQKILSATAATSNVVDLMKQKIEKLPTSVGQRLSIAACLGYSFEPAVLNTVWTIISYGQRDNVDEQESNSFLALVEQEGFLEIEQSSSTAYRWVHDKVQEAAISHVPTDELPSLKAKVGKILVNELDNKELDTYIFTVVNLLKEGGVAVEGKGRTQLAELSLQASKKAVGQSAFESAGKYAGIGIGALPTNAWSNHYELTLELYSTAAEVAGYLGNIELLETCYDEVLKQKDRPLFDKLRVYRAMISYMVGALGRPNDATKLILDILSQLGLKFPRWKGTRLMSIVIGLHKAKRRLSSLRLEDITNLPVMSDLVHLEMMRLLDQLFTAAYMSKSDLLPLSILASIQLTLENGLSDYSAPAFACLASLFGVALGDTALSSKTGSFAKLAMTIVECKNMDAQTEVWLNGFVFCWTDLILRMPPRLLKTYETGLSVGDNEYAMWSIAFYLDYNFLTGKPLETVEVDCNIYLKQMIEFKREVVHAIMSIFFEMVRNLIGRTGGDPTVIKDEQRFLSHSDHFIHVWFYSCQSILYMYFGDYDKGARLAIERGDTYAKGVPGHMWIMIDTFARGMALYAIARITKKRIYTKHAKKVHKIIKSWVRKGNPNVQHYDLLMDAEYAVLSGKLNAADRYYRDAVVSATRRGHIHESAFACERYGEYLLNEGKDPEEARYQLANAVGRYDEWGAARKASMLREKHQDLWHRQEPTEVVVAVSEAGKGLSTLKDEASPN